VIDGSVFASSDAVIGLAIAIPVVVVAGGVAVGMRLRSRRGRTSADGEVVRAPAEPDRNATATRTPGADPSVEPAPHAVVTPGSATAADLQLEEVAEPEPAEPEPEPASYRDRLGKARGLLSGYVTAIRSRSKVDATTWSELEEALIRADVGVAATDALLSDLKTRVKGGEIDGPDALVDALKLDLVSMLSTADAGLAMPGSERPTVGDDRGGDEPGDDDRVDVWLFVGVNGVGKTTTVGKVANRMSASGTKVLLAAGDTFRAAAGEQLSMWATRAGADIVRGSEGGDPSSVVFDAVQRAASRGHAVVLADTAGRLHNKVNLIEELKKMRRVADRPPGRVVEVLLVLDATTGQNGLTQAKVFLEAVDASGVVLTKLDGTAKGGIVVAIQREFGLPVKLVGLGEGTDDLIDFDAEAFVEALF
jgi:fused signal recognition particle receptor